MDATGGETGLRLPAGFSADAVLEVKRSRFLAHVARVDDEDAARAVIADRRAAYPDARHHCTAFIIDVPDAQPVERTSDDGEPSGTAGTPMLEVLRGAGLSNAVAVVTRYFGGTLLGRGGLVRAYSDAVAEALAGTPRVRPTVRRLVEVRVRPDEAGRLQGVLLARGVDVVDEVWDAEVTLRLAIDPDVDVESLIAEVLQRPVPVSTVGADRGEEPVPQ